MILWIFAALLENINLSDSGYDWMKLLKYHMDIRNILRANTASATTQDRVAGRPASAPRETSGIVGKFNDSLMRMKRYSM